MSAATRNNGLCWIDNTIHVQFDPQQTMLGNLFYAHMTYPDPYADEPLCAPQVVAFTRTRKPSLHPTGTRKPSLHPTEESPRNVSAGVMTETLLRTKVDTLQKENKKLRAIISRYTRLQYRACMLQIVGGNTTLRNAS